MQLSRILHKGNSIEVETLFPTLNLRTKGIESVELPEGVVYRVERKGEVDFLAKWVRSDFPTGKFCINIEEKDFVWNAFHNNY